MIKVVWYWLYQSPKRFLCDCNNYLHYDYEERINNIIYERKKNGIESDIIWWDQACNIISLEWDTFKLVLINNKNKKKLQVGIRQQNSEGM